MNREDFINSASEIEVDNKETRIVLANLFEEIQNKVECAHGLADSYYLADHILKSQHVDGPIIEFGCFNGGMSCKLSHVAKLVNKQYFIFDSFTGLPHEAEYKTFDINRPFLGKFHKNQFTCSVENVIENLLLHGRLDACVVKKGLIENTLVNFQEKPSTVFIDVDLIETALFIIENIWDKLQGTRLYTHEACLIDYMDAILDESWWNKTFNRIPPACGVARTRENFGLTDADCLNYLIKETVV
jgi:hypothetical protein